MSQQNENIQYKVVVATAASLAIANSAVLLRFVARRITKISFQVDDYLIIVALLFEWGIGMSGIVLIHHGLGRHIDTITESDLKTYLMTLYCGSFLYAGTIAFTKFSILWLYYRVFPTRYMFYSCIIVAAVVGAWAIAISLVGAFLCNPVHKIWAPETPGTCLNLVSFYYGLQIPNVLTDVVLLVIPVHVILGLPLSKSQKISLLGIFGVGVLTLIFDVIRLVVMVELGNGNGDLTYDQVDASIWTCIEPAVAILAACLPHLRPLDKPFRRLSAGTWRPFKRLDCETKCSENEAVKAHHDGEGFHKIESVTISEGTYSCANNKV